MEWITVKQAMQLLNITSRTTLWQYGMKHRFRVSRLGKKIFYDKQEIMASLERNAVKLGV